jgi:hypothetical protein
VTKICGLCHGSPPCRNNENIQVAHGVCSVCKKYLKCLDCTCDRKERSRAEQIRIYRNTKWVEYDGGFIR